MIKSKYDLRNPSESGIVRDYFTNSENARIIFNEFIIGQSATFKGVEMEEYKIYEKGDLVIKELKSLDRIYNHSIEKANGRMRRKTRTASDVIGYFVDQKAFRFKKETRDGMPVTTIWRVQ